MNYYEIVIAIGFSVLVLFACKLWGIYVVKQYGKKKILIKSRELKPEYYSCDFDELTLAGVGDDGNSDYGFSQAVKKIQLPEDVRIWVDI